MSVTDTHWLGRNTLTMNRYNKYRNKPTTIDGVRFQSKREASRYLTLKLLQKNGNIKELTLQPRFTLQSKFEKNGVKYRAINYVADFQYVQKGKVIVEDTKGFRKERVFLLKQKLFEYAYPDFELVLI